MIPYIKGSTIYNNTRKYSNSCNFQLDRCALMSERKAGIIGPKPNQGRGYAEAKCPLPSRHLALFHASLIPRLPLFLSSWVISLSFPLHHLPRWDPASLLPVGWSMDEKFSDRSLQSPRLMFLSFMQLISPLITAYKLAKDKVSIYKILNHSIAA